MKIHEKSFMLMIFHIVNYKLITNIDGRIYLKLFNYNFLIT